MNLTSRKTILAIDDTPENLRVIKGVLTKDYRIIIATNGFQGIELLKQERPDLVLLDVDMPGMDGFETCRLIKSLPDKFASIPIIFVTANTDTQSEENGLDLGAVDYITKPIRASILERRVRAHLSLVQVDELNAMSRAAIHMLGEAGHYNDTDTGVHIWRMSAYARELAIALGWSEEAALRLELAAPMHDVGKIGIPDTVLKAPRKLTPDEWTIMQQHTVIGAQILSKSDNPVFQLASEIARSHHERWDGGGYPDGLKGSAIPESARIVAIADVFDALTMRRPYKEPWSVDAAFAELHRMAGSHLDADFVSLFEAIREKVVLIKDHWAQFDADQEVDEGSKRVSNA